MVLFTVLFLTSCTAQYTRQVWQKSLASISLTEDVNVQRSASWTIHPNTRVYLSQSISPEENEQGHYRNKMLLHKELNHVFRQVFPDMYFSQDPMTFDDAMYAAKVFKAELLIYPRLVNVDDQLNTWSEFRGGSKLNPGKERKVDKIEIQVLIYDVNTEALIDLAIIGSFDKLFASDKRQIQELFLPALQAYIYDITGKRAG